MGASTSIWDFRTSTLKMIKYFKYRLSSNILLYIESTFDMYLDTITKFQVHFRNYRYVSVIKSIILKYIYISLA